MSKELNIEEIQSNDGEWLTGILESYDNLHDKIILLNITQEDLLDKNENNIQQVGYEVPYGDKDEIEGLIYYYLKKCVEWYDNTRSGIEDLAKEEANLIMEDEEGSENSFLVLLYCQGEYVWSLGG